MMHRLLLQPLQPDDIPAVCGSGPASSIFLVRLLRHLLLHSPIYLTFLMFWHEPDLCTQLAPFSHGAFRVIIPCCPWVLVQQTQCVCHLATAQITAHCSPSFLSDGEMQALPGSQQRVLGRRELQGQAAPQSLGRSGDSSFGVSEKCLQLHHKIKQKPLQNQQLHWSRWIVSRMGCPPTTICEVLNISAQRN